MKESKNKGDIFSESTTAVAGTLISNNTDMAASLLKKGEVIAIPTETVYGLAGNALNHLVVSKIYEIKNRPLTSPLIIHLPDATQLAKYVTNIPAIAEKLAESFWPGALTLLLPKNHLIPDIVTAGLPHVAVRIPKHPVTIKLLRQLDFPLAAPSANPFGYISPTTAGHVKTQLFGKIHYILDGGQCTLGLESTIVGFDNDTPVIYRTGSITVEEIKKVTGNVEIKSHTAKNIAPGMMKSHYSPRTPLFLTNNVETLLKSLGRDGSGILSFKHPQPFIPESHQEILSATGNLSEAARNLYNALHRLDSFNLKRIIAQRLPDIGLGITINDRLERAANNI